MQIGNLLIIKRQSTIIIWIFITINKVEGYTKMIKKRKSKMSKFNFEVKEDFYVDGSKLKIISGSIHYFRSMPNTWEDKIIKLKALGANTVETYVPWNLHEPYEGEWNIDNNLNLPLFLEIATKHEMLIIVRFGPYICAEHDFGGFPWWLLNKEGIKLRCDNDVFLNECDKYLKKIIETIKPYCNTNGGNVIIGQLENEYGSYGNDKEYLEKLYNLIRKHGFEEQLITSDGTWGSMLENGTYNPDVVLPTVNFGSSASEHFDYLEKFNGSNKRPLMCTEFWCGWFSAWGDKEVIKTDPVDTAKKLDAILNQGSVNFYMFHGGTNFGYNGGANQNKEKGYTPDITSYDYDALLDERGNITSKYLECKKVIEKYIHVPNIETKYVPAKSYENVEYIGSSNIFNNDNFEKVENSYPLAMEKLGYGYGYVLYETTLTNVKHLSSIELQGMNDRAQIFLDDKLIGSNFKQSDKLQKFDIEINKPTKLAILVENTGRVNYGNQLEKQSKGINGGVFINNHFYQFNWKMTKLPLDYKLYSRLRYESNTSELTSSESKVELLHSENSLSVPQVHKYKLAIDDNEIWDTYIDMTNFGKGYVFINGFNIGRFWDIGPQYKLFVPSSLLNQGENEVIIIETEGRSGELKFTEE